MVIKTSELISVSAFFGATFPSFLFGLLRTGFDSTDLFVTVGCTSLGGSVIGKRGNFFPIICNNRFLTLRLQNNGRHKFGF